MKKDQFTGFSIFVISVVLLIIYVWLALFSPWSFFVVQVTVVILVSIFLGIVAWIGYVIATTKPPKPIEEIEKELGEELRKLED